MIIIAENPNNWDLKLEGISAFTPEEYIYGDKFQTNIQHKIINLCNSFREGSVGLHISALAESRGHKVIPELKAIHNFIYNKLPFAFSIQENEIVQNLLQDVKENEFSLDIFFGSVIDARYTKIGVILFNLIQLPLIKVKFIKQEEWKLSEWDYMTIESLSSEQFDFYQKAIEFFINGKKIISKNFKSKKYELAILVNPDDPTPPSNAGAIQKFIKAADDIGFNSELININDFGKIRKYDALFIRETTRINHHTFNFAIKAAQEGLVVIDHPEAIIKCNNRIYLMQMLKQNNLLNYRSSVVEKKKLIDSLEQGKIDFPVIAKNPVKFLEDDQHVVLETKKDLKKINSKPDLLIVEEIIYPDSAWRIGIFNQEIIFAGKYYVESNEFPYQNSSIYEPWPVDEIPVEITVTSFKISNMLGGGLYAIDIFQKGGEIFVMKIFDNPDINADKEDQLQPQAMYTNIMRHIYERCGGS